MTVGRTKGVLTFRVANTPLAPEVHARPDERHFNGLIAAKSWCEMLAAGLRAGRAGRMRRMPAFHPVATFELGHHRTAGIDPKQPFGGQMDRHPDPTTRPG
jgi:hypothetical protein